MPQKPWVIFAGTMSDFSAGTRGKIFRSNDWGRTWREVVRDVSVTRIAVDPKNPSIVYAALAWVNFTAPGIIKSTDGGHTWFRSDRGMYFDESGIACLEIDPVNTNILYAGEAGFFGGGAYKTTNGGKYWMGLTYTVPGEEFPMLADGVTTLAIDPSNTNIVYAGTAWRGQVYKSTDAGLTWRVIFPSSAGIVYSLALSTRYPQIIYAGFNLRGLRYSTDGGNVWVKPASGLQDTLTVSSITVYDASTLFFVGNWRDDGGIYQSIDSGMSWKRIGIDRGRVGALALDRLNCFLYATKGGIYRRKLN